jgi:hypothetical protein
MADPAFKAFRHAVYVELDERVLDGIRSVIHQLTAGTHAVLKHEQA